MTIIQSANPLDTFSLNEQQRLAALERGRDVVATAGAGSGKTRTLVARYISLLAEGIPPRRIAAITFTNKAAREMRSRVREELFTLQANASTEHEREYWSRFASQMDAARISTIHSLCAEIIRSHPVELGVDPRFDLVDESLSTALRIQAVEDTLKALVEEDKYTPLLQNITTYNFKELLFALHNHRLKAREIFQNPLDYFSLLHNVFKERMNHPALTDPLDVLQRMTKPELIEDAGDKLAVMIEELLTGWAKAEAALKNDDPVQCALMLYEIRRSHMRLNLGKGGEAKASVYKFRDAFDKLLNPLTGGKNSKDLLPSQEAELLFSELQPLLGAAFETVCQTYKRFLDARQALDFDDLEQGTVELLQNQTVRQLKKKEFDAILVDEFQDTNQRQQEIIEALAGEPGRLFIVGDMRQSIYRFRQADVTVFKHVQDRIYAEGGLVIDLPFTYRAHQPLLLATESLLAPLIGTQPDPTRDYYVPFTSMEAYQKLPPNYVQPPHVEFIVGIGEDTASASPRTARALTLRLQQFKEEGQIKSWDEVALLFGATVAYADYEEALEEAGIPFVTVAGRGFYDRPEIRDLINILRTLADPLDDLSLAGLLRSPAFGLSDAALHLLRQTGLPYWRALQEDLSSLSQQDQTRAKKTRSILDQLLPLVDRVPVVDLLSNVITATNYKAILATADVKTGFEDAGRTGGRLWRNLDKLVSDAAESGELRLRNYLDRIKTLNDAGAREGEASTEAEGSVQLMTIHRSKGLEFKVVVLAAAGRSTRSATEVIYLFQEYGAAFKLDPPAMIYNLAKDLNKDQDEMEALRLIYVALTRAKHKLIINGHGTSKKEGDLSFRSWMSMLIEAAGLTTEDFLQAGSEPFRHSTETGQLIDIRCAWSDLPSQRYEDTDEKHNEIPISKLRPLYLPIASPTNESDELQEAESDDIFSWRTHDETGEIHGVIVGRLVHKAIHRWFFPGNPRLDHLLEAEALRSGVVDINQRSTIITQAKANLRRLQAQPIWTQINTAQKRYHELPYTLRIGPKVENGFIDLVYQDHSGWHILDFKTDPVTTSKQRNSLIEKYAFQIRRYQQAVRQLLKVDPSAHLCFTDDGGAVSLVEVD